MLLAPVPWAQRVWALPVLTALTPSQRYDCQHQRHHKTLTEHARGLLLQMARWLPGRELVMLGDSNFAALQMLQALAPKMSCITRLRLNAALYAPAPPRPAHTMGRPAKKGARLPALAQRVQDARTRWQRVEVAQWYSHGARSVEIASGCAVWYHPGMPVLPLRWVLIRDPLGHFDPQALLCTRLDMPAQQVVQYFVRRWQVEIPHR